jgi:hypothetical protein
MLSPGQLFASRYAIVTPVGHGGMGSVYRADDLRLHQTVALKLLRPPCGGAGDAERLAHEVRLAREVSHPNVCRVYDIGSDGGIDYLTMEFVDGETLASRMRRPGGVTAAEAVDIARQICAGLAAAHERGVLHRDIKPSNVMIDASGRVRILDFGLAVTADAAVDGGRAGTPAYMAPEQVHGGAPSARSDIYALGLVLYELFTGDRLYQAFSLAERADAGAALLPATSLRDVDVAMQAVIRWCLEIDPANRAASAVDVVAMLRGGDARKPSASRRDIPSPELILAGEQRGALTAAQSLVFAAVALLGLALVAPFVDHLTRISGAVPKPPWELASRAAAILTLGGAPDPAQNDGEFWFEPDRSEAPRAMGPRAIRFVYRQDSGGLRPTNLFRVVTISDPPPAEPGMSMVILDASGRLRTFETVSFRRDTESGTRPVDWASWFALAGLNPLDYFATEPGPSVRAPHDRQLAWRRRDPSTSGPIVRAALVDGRLAYFAVGEDAPIGDEVTGLWSTRRTVAAEAFFSALILICFVGAGFIGVRNLKHGRGHVEAANRMATFVAACGITAGLLRAHHGPSIETPSFVLSYVGWCLMWAAFCWVAYVALEPSIRHQAPQTLAAWTRLVSARFGDPVVGREVLVGTLGGLVVIALAALRYRLAPIRPAGFVLYPALESLRSWQRFAFVHLFGLADAVQYAVAGALLIALVRPVVRILAVSAFVVALLTLPVSIGGLPISAVDALLAVAIMLMYATVFMRAGLLALTTTFTVERLLSRAPITLHASVWYFPASAVTLSLVAVLAIYGAAVTCFSSTLPVFAARRRLAVPSRSRSS